jgi:hypothetical protein
MRPTGTPGRQFVQSKAYRNLISGDGLPGNWTTGAGARQDAPRLERGRRARTAWFQADVRPGILSPAEQRPTVADLCASAPTSSPLVRYMQEDGSSNGATGVAEGHDKPESALGFIRWTSGWSSSRRFCR